MAPVDRPALHAPTLPELLEARARETPTAEGLRFEGRSLAWEELRARVALVAADLLSLGVRPGDRVALIMPNGLEFPVAWLAIPKVRAVAVPVSVDYKRSDLAHVLKHSGAVVALTGKDQRGLVEEVGDECPALAHIRVLEESTFDSIDGVSSDDLGVIRSDPADPTTLQYTSGTTGLPKACVVDHGYWLRLARTVLEAARLGADDVLLTAQPQSYMDPSWNLVMALMAGAPLVILPRFSASRFWAQARENQVTFFYCIGAMPLFLLKQPPDPLVDRGHRVRLVYCSGIPAAVHEEMEVRWGCLWRETYGTTELGVVLLAPPGDGGSVGSGSMGRPVNERQVRVVEDSGVDVGEGCTGELLVKGPDRMRGYWDDPVATAAWLQDGWALTGDRVTRLADGGFALVGRTKDMIRRAGESVSA
ncbi:MAG: AMP-binding protein, partial [Longimicrobiales bacterium]